MSRAPKVTHWLTPQNEGQDMNCQIRFSGTDAAAIKKAQQIARALQEVLDGADIRCEIEPLVGEIKWAEANGRILTNRYQ
jgi:hypothetical protein